MDRTIIEQYASGSDELIRGIAGLTREELNSHPVPNTWSIQQIVMHLLDADLIASDRMKRIIAEDNPLLIGYNETKFAERLHYDKADAMAAAQLFASNRNMTAALLRHLREEDFLRTGVHNEAGKMTLVQLVKGYHDHLHHHMKFLREKRRMLGKAMD